MTRAAVVLLVIAACNAGGGGDDEFPVSPGGGRPGGGVMVDAAMIDTRDADGDTPISGRVCLVVDLRGAACAASGAGGITVTLGAQTATTADDGAFAIAAPQGSNLVWHASTADLVTSVMAFSTSTTIPAITLAGWNELELANGVVTQGQQGAIIARIVQGGTPLAGATVTATPVPQYATHYDGPTAAGWTELATGAAGVAWLPGVGVGAATLAVVPPTGSGGTAAVHVEDHAITFVTIAL
jgi:hypothetical protein